MKIRIRLGADLQEFGAVVRDGEPSGQASVRTAVELLRTERLRCALLLPFIAREALQQE